MFIVLLTFKSLAIKFVSLNNEPCMARPIFIGLNPVEPNYYPFMISLDKCSWRFNAADDIPFKNVFWVKQKMKKLKYLI